MVVGLKGLAFVLHVRLLFSGNTTTYLSLPTPHTSLTLIYDLTYKKEIALPSPSTKTRSGVLLQQITFQMRGWFTLKQQTWHTHYLTTFIYQWLATCNQEQFKNVKSLVNFHHFFLITWFTAGKYLDRILYFQQTLLGQCSSPWLYEYSTSYS